MDNKEEKLLFSWDFRKDLKSYPEKSCCKIMLISGKKKRGSGKKNLYFSFIKDEMQETVKCRDGFPWN